MPEIRSSARPPLSGVVTCFNEERHIEACLASLDWCDEIVVLDSFSTDRTPELARAHPKVRFFQRTYFGAASAKNFAMDQARHDWLLVLDSDERCPPGLRAEIEDLLSVTPAHEAYTVGREVWILGGRISFSGWQRDRVVRLFRRGAARLSNSRVHPKVLTRGQAPLLRHRLVHFMVDDWHEYLRRTVKYGWWGAAQAWREGRRSGLPEVAGRTAWRFLKAYVLRLGVLDGTRGLVFCLCQAFATYSKWSILWSWTVNDARGMPPDLPAFDEDETTWRQASPEPPPRM